MDNHSFKRPRIPGIWNRPTLFGFISYLLFTVAWLPLFGFLTWRVVHSDLSPALKVALAAPCIVLAGHGFHMLGWFAHDGVHLSLLRNKYWSMLVGTFAAGAALFPLLGYGITHWTHHRFTNQASDPDVAIYPQYKTFWTRFFLSRVTANRGYLRNTVASALGRDHEKGYRIPFTRGWTRFFAICTLLSMLGWLCAYITLARFEPQLVLLCIVLPYLCAAPMTGLRIYLEHNGTGAGIFADTRSYVSPFWTFVMFGNNFHLEHHLYPTVPAYHLIRVHRLLRDDGVYAKMGSHIVPGVLTPLQYLGADYDYPMALLEDLEADPFGNCEEAAR